MKTMNIHEMKNNSHSRNDARVAREWLKVVAVFLLIFTLGIGSVWADSTAKLFWASGTNSAPNYYFTSTSGSVTSVLSFSCTKNSSSTTPAYNSSNSQLRLYYNSNKADGNGNYITITAASGITFTGFTIKSTTAPTTKYSIDGGALTSLTLTANTDVSVSSLSCTSIKIQNCNTTDTQLRIKYITITYTVATPKSITWSVNGANWNTGHGTPSTSVYAGSKVTALPTAPTSSDCDDSKVFVGWTATPIVGTTNTKPSDLFTTAAGAPTVTDDVTYYAVFADEDEDDVTATFGWESADDATKWTMSNLDAKATYTTYKNSGSYASSNGSSTTAYIKYNTKVSPTAISCKYTKATSNTNSSSKFIIQTSADGSSWTDKVTGKTMNNVTQGTFETLSWSGSLSDVYVRIYLTTTATTRVIDDVSITYSSTSYSNYATTCGCTSYSFHYGATANADGKNITDQTVECFSQVGSTTEWQLADFTIPTTTQYYFVGYAGFFYDSNIGPSGASNSGSERNQFKYLPVANLQGSSCSGSGDSYKHAAAGAHGKIRIYSDNSGKNIYAGFIPSGYQMRYGTNGGSDWANIQLTQVSSSAVWKSAVMDLTAAMVAKRYYVNVWTSGSYAADDEGVAINNWTDGGSAISSMQRKTNSGENWASGVSAGMRGFFRTWTDNCANNGYMHFVPTHRIIYHSNYPDGAGEGPADTYSVDVSVEETNSSISLPSGPTAPTGYTFAGWFTAASGGTQRTGSQTISAGASADTELYAHWTPKSCTVTFDKNSGTDGDNSVTATYGEAMPTITPPTRVGYTFGGYFNSETDNNGTGTKYYNADGSSARNWDVNTTSGQTLYANWSAKSLTNYRTECGLDITVEGSVWLTSYAGVEVYTTEESENLITIDCDDFGDATRLGVAYLLNGSPVTYTSSPFRLCWYNFTGKTNYNKVDADGSAGSASPYRYYPLTSSEKTALGSSQTFAISYNPGAGVYNQEHTYTLRIAVLDGSGNDLGHKDLTLHGRALPQKFVIAASIGGQWRALPADLATSAGTAVQDAYPIQVDNESTPTTAIAPKTAVYSGYTRNNGAQHRGGIRLQTQVGDDKDGYLEAPRSNSLTYLRRTTSTDGYGMQEWYLKAKTTEFGLYNISLDPACTLADGTTPITRYLCVYSNQIYWGAQSAKDFRILPVTEYVPVEIQVVEWASDKIRFMYLGNPDYEAEVKIDNVTKASAAELSTLKIDEGVYEIAVSDLMSSGYKIMHIIIKNGGTEVGRQAVNVPLLVNTTTTVATAAAGFTKGTQCPRMDLVVLSGGKLTAEDATAYQFKSTTVYGGGKLIIDDSKGLNAGTMYLRAGSVNVATKGATPSTSYIYTYPQVYIGSGATLTVSGNIINFDYLTNYDQYFGLALPYPVTLATGIGYPADIYGSAKAGSFLLRTFDSKIRAAQGAVDAVWADIEETNTGSGGSITAQTATTRGLGYYLLSPPRKMSINGGDAVRQKYGIQRLKMDVSSMAENSNASISVTAYPSAQPYNAGWWLLGNPYMANLGGAGVTGTSITVGYLGADASGNAEWKDKSVRYVTVPNDDASETYNQQTVESYTFPAFKPFYVQVGATGTVTFATANRAAAAPKRFTQDGIPAEIATAVALNSTAYGDTTHILIGNVFSDEYEVGDDLMKMPHANVSLFTISNGTDLFSNALNSQSALAGIHVGYTAPDSSRYVFSHVPKADDAWIEHIWLKDKELGLQKDLLEGSYEFDSEASSNKSRFELVIELRTSPSVTTDIENAGEENITQPMKFIWHDQLYILRNGKLYDATGKRVKEINK